MLVATADNRGQRVLRTIPEPCYGILGGILQEFLALDPLLRVGHLPTPAANEVPAQAQNFGYPLPELRYGFCLRYKHSFTAEIIVQGAQIWMHEHYKTRRYTGGGWCHGDIQDPAAFERWLGVCAGTIKHHIADVTARPLRRTYQQRFPWAVPSER